MRVVFVFPQESCHTYERGTPHPTDHHIGTGNNGGREGRGRSPGQGFETPASRTPGSRQVHYILDTSSYVFLNSVFFLYPRFYPPAWAVSLTLSFVANWLWGWSVLMTYRLEPSLELTYAKRNSLSKAATYLAKWTLFCHFRSLSSLCHLSKWPKWPKWICSFPDVDLA
jgi:hypothetical protein